MLIERTTYDLLHGSGARCDAGPALAAAGALFVPGPTGVNHADVALAM